MGVKKEFNPLVTVVIPTRNRKALLLYAIKSVLSQTYRNIQLIVHDNNSVDDSKAYIEEKIQDSRIEYFFSNKDLSMTENWNTALKYVRGDFFVRLDDDNIFFPGFIEKSVRSIDSYNLDCIAYSPLIIHRGTDLRLLFDNENGDVHVLSRFQLYYLEYLCLTDSNYIVYKTKFLKRNFKDFNLYESSLPDRYLNYRIAQFIKKQDIRFGFSTEALGVTRFDYRNERPENYQYNYVDYSELFKSGRILNSVDCQSNFTMHQVNTLHFFLKKTIDEDSKKFFSKIVDPVFYTTKMKLGHLNEKRVLDSLNEFIVFQRYYCSIIWDLVTNPNKFISEKKAWRFILGLTRTMIMRTAKFVTRKLIYNNSVKKVIDPTLGNYIVKTIIENKYHIPADMKSENGSLNNFFQKIDVLLKKK